MSRHMVRTAAILLLTMMLALTSAAGAAPARRLKWTAQEVGTGLLVWTTAISDITKRELPKDVSIDILPYGAIVASLTLVNDGKADIGWGDVTSAWAREGVILFDKQHPNVRAIASGFSESILQIFVTKDFAQRTGIKSLDDLKTRRLPVRIVTKPRGTLGQAAGALQLEAHGITYDDIRKWGGSITETSVSDIVSLMKDKRADIWFDYLAEGHPSATELTQTADIVMLENSPEARRKLESYGFHPVLTKAGTWRGQNRDLQQLGGSTVLTCRYDLDDDVVYAIAKAIFENADEIRAAHASMQVFSEKAAWKAPIPLHPAAARFYREQGLIK